MSVKHKYKRSKRINLKFQDEVKREEKFLSNLGLLGRGIKSHASLRTKTGSTPLWGVERAGIYKKKIKGTVNLGDTRVLDWLHQNHNR